MWIAFIFQYLWDTQQQKAFRIRGLNSCELLSFFSIFGIHNNATPCNALPVAVVNCFHFSVSLGYTTTVQINITSWTLLWIAFIFQYLWDTQQLNSKLAQRKNSCELLSFFSIFGIHNNVIFNCLLIRFVVNCFHFSVSLGYTTTKWYDSSYRRLLWIAFIFQYLWDTQQPTFLNLFFASCCELLSFFSIFGIHNNNFNEVVHHIDVVNCFHFSVSLGYTTTEI